MPEPITLYRVFLAAPSDVTDELIVVEGLLRDWNLQHGQELGVRVELVELAHAHSSSYRQTPPSIGKQAGVRPLRFGHRHLLVSIWNPDGTGGLRYRRRNPAWHQARKTSARIFLRSTRSGTEASRAFPHREIQAAIWTEGALWFI